MMRRIFQLMLSIALLGIATAFAQTSVPEISYDSAVEPLKLPDNNSIYLGENVGIASNSKGDIFVFTRTGHPTMTLGTARPFAHGGSRLFEFDKNGRYVREIGKDSYGFEVAQMVRVDPQDNVWTVDQMSNMVIKWDPNGRVALLLGRKAEAERIPGQTGGGGEGGGAAGNRPPGAGEMTDIFNRPTDVAWDAAGNIYITDGNGNSRVAKFDKNGKFIKTWGQRGSEPGQFAAPHGIVIDAKGMVYVADRDNRRIQVFDGDGNFKTQYTNVGRPSAICITPGPHQYLYSSNSNAPNDIDRGGEIYKMELDGTVVGKFGRAGRMIKEFGDVNAMDCKSDSQFWVAEMITWRVQKLSLHPQGTQTASARK